MAKRCCAECFGDRGLRKDIIPGLSSDIGDCNFCGTKGVVVVEPALLADVCGLLQSVYVEAADGKLLVDLMRSDWHLFGHPKMDEAHAKELLAEVLDDGEIVRRNFVPSPAYESRAVAMWEGLRDELMYHNRYFLDEGIDKDRLRELLDMLIADDMPSRWHRARISPEGTEYLLADMGPPPKRVSTAGRANPPGIPYLYLGSKPETAIAEVRPHTGEIAYVAEFEIPALNAVDLRSPRSLVSPFILGGAEAIGQLRADIPFLERLGDELTRPVLPSGAAIDYLPSQYLCEFIKKAGYDGVVYRSSVSDGINLALFDPSKGQGKVVTRFEVANVSVEIKAA